MSFVLMSPAGLLSIYILAIPLLTFSLLLRPNANPLPPPSSPPQLPITVAPKPKKRCKQTNVFVDDRGFPYESEYWDHLLHTIDSGTVLRKLKYPQPPLDDIDPSFNVQFDPAIHGPILDQKLDTSHLDNDTATKLKNLIIKYWAVFDESTAFVPVKNYECVIDTGTARPIAVRKINYGHLETPIMRRCIAALEKVGHIRQIHDGQWLFKALLAPKPHQEHIYNIDNFVWRFGVNYIPLNQVTRLIAYPIPRCDTAVHTSCGNSSFHWIVDAPMGYHQLAVEAASQEKLAFQGPDGTKWTYNVMPFGPTNGPATFIAFILDIDSIWKNLARSEGIVIDDDTNTNVIVDDIIFSWARSLGISLSYLECQLRVAKSYRLSFNLGKSKFFPKRIEFVGIDVCDDGNRPAMSKRQLVETWPMPLSVCDVAKFVGFGQFYSRFIPNFEIAIAPLRAIMKHEHTQSIDGLWTEDATAAWKFIQDSILADPCLMRFDHRKLTVIRTDFSSAGFGYVVCQPASDDVSLAAMTDFMSGKNFNFMTPDSKAILRPVAFGARRCRGNESRLHSHLGEGFAGDWAISKCRHMCFGRRFAWVTDCVAIRYILGYSGGNPAVHRLQMRLMGWDMDIVHRKDIHLVDADYWSRIDADLCYDPLLRQYLKSTAALSANNPVVTNLPIEPPNMPYYRGPRIRDNTAPECNDTTSNTHAPSLTIIPVHFGQFLAADNDARSEDASRELYHSDVTRAAWQLSSFRWAVYSFNSGHFFSTAQHRNLPFSTYYACDPHVSGRSLLAEFGSPTHIFLTGHEMLNYIRAAGDTTPLHGYLIHSQRYSSSEPTTKFWQLQSSIVEQLHRINQLSMVVAIVHPDHNRRSVAQFSTTLSKSGWLLSQTTLHFPAIGDSIVDSTNIIIAVHSATSADATTLQLKQPPSLPTRPLSEFIWSPFNTKQYSVSYAPHDTLFNSDASPRLTSTAVMASHHNSPLLKAKYVLRPSEATSTQITGAIVYDSSSLCPPFVAAPNVNIFQHYFGIEFIENGHTHIRPISPFEFASCFGLDDDLTYKLALPQNAFCLDSALPANTSAWIFEQVLDRLHHIRDSNTEIFSPTEFGDNISVCALTHAATSQRMPTHAQWVTATASDDELQLVKQFTLDPSLITNSSLMSINYNYRSAFRKSLITFEDDVLIYKEPIAGGRSYTRLRIVPKDLQNIIFIAFHTNAAGGHLNAYRTMHRIRLRFYWPHMFKYVQRMCRACPGCALANPTRAKSSELLYNFPVDAPFRVLHVDAYSAGKHSGFEGSEVYIIGCCGLSSFACMEPVAHASASTFASAIMKIQLRYGLCHTIVLDKDSKLMGTCREALDSLHINCHVLSGGNHNPMIAERVNRYLNKGLRVMTNERNSVRVAMECILLLIYAWNSCPIPGTDISRSLVAVGREFSFPIDFETNAHLSLTSATPSTVESYAKELFVRLTACREIATILVDEHRTWHRELINSRRPDPHTYSVGDIVFARRSVRSQHAKEKVDKLMFAFTGPWRITASLDGGSYAITHCRSHKKDKKHASDLSPYPQELLPLVPLDSSDNQFSQLHKVIQPNPFTEAGIEGYIPPTPYATSQFVSVETDKFHWPTLAELNDECLPPPWRNESKRLQFFAEDKLKVTATMYTGPTPPPVQLPLPSVPPLSALVASIINSSDRLFFVSLSIGDGSVREWKLVRVNFDHSVAQHPSCLQDGKFLVELYTLHPGDCRFNNVNQRYWLHYYPIGGSPELAASSETHLIKPSDTSSAYAERRLLTPFQCWINITHHDTYIHGPFDFAIINGRKTRDRISADDWKQLEPHAASVANKLPSSQLPTYSIHADHHFYTHILR